MNKTIRKVAIALAVLMAAVFVNLNFIQVVKGGTYSHAADNRRVLLNEYSSPRGNIVVQGTAVAESKQTSDELKYLRVYPQGAVYAPVTGYYSYVFGSSGIESAEDSVLSGNDSRLFGAQLGDLLTGRNRRGGSVELTLNKAAQQAAYSAMKGGDGRLRRGAVVALDPSTGAILAAVSTPSYDPSTLSSHNSNTLGQAWQELNTDTARPLANRAFGERYPPGSTFKVIVTAAALKDGVKPTDQLIAPNGYYPDSGRAASKCPKNSTACIQNFNGETCSNGKTASLAFSLAKSCNTTFAALAVEKVGGDRLAAEAKLFGFDGASPLKVPLSVAASTVGTRQDLTENGFLARTAFGQQDVTMTPLQGAMISAAVANYGTLMQPYLVSKELGPNLSLLHRTDPTQLSQVIDADLDQQLQSMMEGVITSPEGTGHSASITDIPGVVVGGKTGTADTGLVEPNGKAQPPHAWFTGYAMQNGTPRIAVAVIIENGGVQGNETTGGAAAAPVAKAVMEAYLKSLGGN